jgi:acyl-CoA reductase-like NAD-dependent aldehyde dehydrogenase
MTSLLLAAIIAESEWPRAALSVLPCLSEEADQLVIDERIKLVTFTGSPSVGWTLKSRAGRKRVVLELGGNAGVIVEKDADVADALTRIVAGAFANAGQSCISVQRVFVHREILPAFERALLEHVRNLVVGNPNNEATIVGPMITEAAAVQAEDWVREAVDAGARLLCGGSREAAVLQPTVLSGVRKDLPVSCCEVFAPVMILEGFLDFHDAVEQVNDSDFGLQAGVFTNDLRKVLQAYRDLDVGGVIINDVPTYRIDHMPYGGVKHSGFGREGIRYAMEEMTELKLLAVNPR